MKVGRVYTKLLTRPFQFRLISHRQLKVKTFSIKGGRVYTKLLTRPFQFRLISHQLRRSQQIIILIQFDPLTAKSLAHTPATRPFIE